MNQPLPARLLTAACLILHSAFAGAGGAPPAKLPWQALEFERKSIWATANSKIELADRAAEDVAGAWKNPGEQKYLHPTGSAVRELTIAASAGENEARLHLLLDPHSAAIYQRDRFSIGRKDRRNKFYRYHAGGVTRIRREPLPDEVDLSPEQWSRVSKEEIAFPALPEGAVVTSPYALLVLSSQISLAPGESAVCYVHTDHNLYRVEMRRGADQRTQASFQMRYGEGESKKYDGKRLTRTIQFIAEPTEQSPDRPDFELLGLGGEVSLLIDEETGLPLRVAGVAPRLGSTYLDLKAATLFGNPPGAGE